MASNEWLVRKLHEQDKKIEALSRGGTGVGHSSIAPGENLTVISDNGEVVLGAGGVEHVDGPTPATPSAPTLKLGFGTIETTWDGTFAEGEDEDGVPLTAPVDFDVVEVHCSTDPEEEEWGEDTMRGQIKTREGGTITVGGFDVDDEVFVCLIALAKTGKRSAPSATASLVIEGLDFSQLFTEIDAANATIKNAGEVLVTEQDTLNDKLADAFGQIEDAITSANGKNVVHYEDAPPTVDDPGVEGDTWFVGEFGRTEQLLATNLALNPSFTTLANQRGTGEMTPSSGTAVIVTADWAEHGTTALKLTPTASNNTTAVDAIARENTGTASDAGKTFTISANIHLDAAQTGTLLSHPRRIVVRTRYGGFTSASYAYSDSAPNEPGTHRVSVTFTLQPNTEWWYFMLTNGSSTVPVYWDSIMIEEGAGSGAYFDGDTTDGATEDDPHYRWTGVEHASTSQKYLPAVLASGSDAWQITQQFKFTGGSWVQVELNHQVISSMDVGKLVAGSAAIKEAVVQKLWAEVVVTKMAVAEQFIGENAILTGAVTAPKITASEELWAKIAQFVKIRAEHIEADAIDGMVITGPNIRTAASGARVQMDPNGVRVFNGDDDVRTHLSPDGSTFKGEVEAETMVVNDGAEFNGNNTLAQGAKLTLAAGVTDPTAPPTVQPYWDGISFARPAGSSTPRGLAYTTGKYWTFVGTTDRIISIDSTTGAVVDSFPMTNSSGVVDAFWGSGGVTAIGDELFVLGEISGSPFRLLVRVYSTSGEFLREWEYEQAGWSPTNRLVYKPGIGTDGTNVVIAHCDDLGSLIWRTFNKTTGALLNTVNRGDKTKSDITGIYIGPGDWGSGTRVAVAKKSTSTIQVFTTNGSATEWSWYTAGTDDRGIVYVDGKWRTLDPSGVIHEYADINTGDGSSDWWATYYWYTDVDDDGTIESSDYRSRMSPPTRFMWPRRAMLKILGQPMPTGVGALGPALAKKTTKPTRTDFHGPGWSVDAGKPSARYITLPTNWATYSSPSDTNTFPEAESSVLQSSSGLFEVKGDGSGRWGPLTFNPDGTMSSPP